MTHLSVLSSTSFLLVLFAVPGFTQDRETGNDLLTNCNTTIKVQEDGIDGIDGEAITDVLDSSRCLFYLAGFRDAVGIQKLADEDTTDKEFFRLCIPDGATNGQLIRVVLKYLEENPSELHQDQAALVFFALQSGFPCTD